VKTEKEVDELFARLESRGVKIVKRPLGKAFCKDMRTRGIDNKLQVPAFLWKKVTRSSRRQNFFAFSAK